MKILYGVQGTGNGHITRARCLATEFKRLNIDVDYVFSGRRTDKYFDMDIFDDARYFQGLTFVTVNHKIDYLQTLKQLKPVRFLRELQSLDVNDYDLVISDFEPITAWRSRFSRVPSLGIGHQYSFHSNVPWPKYNRMGKTVLKHFAPVKKALGVHWHHFNGPILPPIIDVTLKHQPSAKPFALVYLPFYDPVSAACILQKVRHTNFILYSPAHKIISKQNNVTLKPLSKKEFRTDLQACTWLVSSCGFGLVSEALHMGIPILSIPVQGQGEQLANALALEQLGYGDRYTRFSKENLEAFLDTHPIEAEREFAPMQYPNVAAAVAQFCANGANENLDALVASLWQSDNAPQQQAA
jgi:uncharacterized protein (TIGR00661 family)